MPTASAQRAFADPESFATTLLVAFVDEYGPEACHWSPETIQAELQDDFRLRLPQASFDRLMVAISLVTSDTFYRSLPDFITFCNILSGDTYDPRMWDPASAVEIAWGLTEGLIIWPPDDNDENPFSEEIAGYIGQVLDQEGIINPPDILRIAIRENDPVGQVAGSYSDDPEMFNAIYDFEASKTTDINTTVREALTRLSQQLEQLQTQNGSTSDIVRRLVGSLSNQP